jgi:hypothetical protein
MLRFISSAAVIFLAAETMADELTDHVRPALVTVLATGTSSGSVTEENTVQGTGFFINKEGHVATAFHVIKQLGPIIGGTLKLTVFRNDTNISSPAIIEFQQPDRDVLILKIPTAGVPTKPLTIANDAFNKIQPAVTRLRTAGFPFGFPFKEDSGVLNSFDGPNGPDQWLWVVQMRFQRGQSGSPVFLDDGQVVGVAKGTDDTEANGYIIPMRYFPLTQYVSDSAGQGRKVTVTARASTPELRVQENVQQFSDSSTSCSSAQRERRIQLPVGQELDPTSISFSVRNGSFVSGISIKDISNTGFTVAYVLKPQCFTTPFGQTISLKQANLDMSLAYKSRQLVETSGEKVIATGSLGVGDQVYLPEDVDIGSVKIDTIEPSGAVRTTTGNDLVTTGGANGLGLTVDRAIKF